MSPQPASKQAQVANKTPSNCFMPRYSLGTWGSGSHPCSPCSYKRGISHGWLSIGPPPQSPQPLQGPQQEKIRAGRISASQVHRSRSSTSFPHLSRATTSVLAPSQRLTHLSRPHPPSLEGAISRARPRIFFVSNYERRGACDHPRALRDRSRRTTSSR